MSDSESSRSTSWLALRRARRISRSRSWGKWPARCPSSQLASEASPSSSSTTLWACSWRQTIRTRSPEQSGGFMENEELRRELGAAGGLRRPQTLSADKTARLMVRTLKRAALGCDAAAPCRSGASARRRRVVVMELPRGRERRPRCRRRGRTRRALDDELARRGAELPLLNRHGAVGGCALRARG